MNNRETKKTGDKEVFLLFKSLWKIKIFVQQL
jgi:hypothetical protein